MSRLKCFIKKIIMAIVIASCISLCIACEAKKRTKANAYSPRMIPFNSSFSAFDTECTMSIYGKMNSSDADDVIEDIKEIIESYDLMFSKSSIDSELYKINHRTENIIYTYSEVAKLFSVAKDMYKWTDGYFDISASPLCDLWDVKNRKTLPSSDEINKAIKMCGRFNYDIVEGANKKNSKSDKIIFLDSEPSEYDFGALVKGYVCDAIREYFEEHNNVDAAIINLGGNVYCYGEMKKRDDGLFKVGIYKPFSDGEIIDTVSVKDKCVITSGNYQRYFKIPGDDRIYHHIINPKDGYPASTGIDSVTIVSENGLLGDFLSTACMLIGKENSKVLIDKCKEQFDGQEIGAIFVLADGKVEKYEASIRNK